MSRVIYLDERKQIVVGDGDTHLMEVGATVGPAGLWTGSEATIPTADNADLVPVRDASDSNNPKFITRANFLSGVGGGSLTVEEVDGSPSVSASEMRFPNGSLSVSGAQVTFQGLPGAIVRRNSAQSIPTSTFTAITFDDPALSDLGGFWNSANPTRLTVPSGMSGVYRVSVFGAFATSSVGIRQWNLRINGSTYEQLVIIDPNVSYPTADGNSIELPLSAGDYVEFVVYHERGSALDFGATGDYCARMSICWIRN